MKSYITWERLKPDTANGEQVRIQYTYTSPNKEEIDEMQKYCDAKFGSGVVIEEGSDAFCRI